MYLVGSIVFLLHTLLNDLLPIVGQSEGLEDSPECVCTVNGQQTLFNTFKSLESHTFESIFI